MDTGGTLSAKAEKQRRNYETFLADLGILKKYFEDTSITDIKIIGSGDIIIEKFPEGKIFTEERMQPAEVQALILSAAALLGLEIDWSTGLPKLECTLPPPHRMRFTGILPPAVNAAQVAMRRPAARIFTLEEYLANGQIKKEEYDLVCECIAERKNILVGGSTGSGKTTFTNAILRKMVENTPNDSFYIVEDTEELQCAARDLTSLRIDKRAAAEAVRTALRWTPDRIIFGEVRYGEVAEELIKSWNTGHTGNVTTVHADTAESMIPRMQEIIAEVIKGRLPDLTQAIHLCVHLSRISGRPPVVDSVLRIEPGAGNFYNFVRNHNLA